MRGIVERLKLLVFGRPIASDTAQPLRLPSRLAIGVFGASLLSTVAYAPDAVIDALRRGGQQAALPWMALGVVAIMALLAAAYRSNVRKRPDERGDYGLVRDRLGRSAGVVTGASLLVDYIFTVAVSVAAIAEYLDFLVPGTSGYHVQIALVAIAIMTMASLRGFRERTRLLFGVWFGFLLVISVAFAGGIARLGEEIAPGNPPDASLSTLFAFAGAIASGAVMVTGIEHLASSGPYHLAPRAKRAGRTLVIAVLVGAAAFLAVTLMVWRYRVSGWQKGPVLLQATERIFDNPAAAWLVALPTVAILYAAATAVFRRFSRLTSLLARDSYLPRQLAQQSDRLVFRGGVLWVAGASALLILLTGARVQQLIHMYLIGAFAAIVLSQVAMFRLQSARIALQPSGSARMRMRGTRVLHGAAAAVAALVWIVVAVFNFGAGAWFALLLIAALVVLMHGISRHYANVAQQLAIEKDDRAGARPSATHGVVLVAQLHRPALRAIAYAKAARHSSLEAVTVQIDKDTTKGIQRRWGTLGLGLPLVILDSPYRDLVGPVLDHVRGIHRESPRDMVVVYVPEYIVGRWWERFLHNRASMRLRDRLLEIPQVVVSAVPWHLESARDVLDTETAEVPVVAEEAHVAKEAHRDR
ncbi:APC family permease [Demequina pelophila]|uniref:APC family permease n=1 Tax=Demequina pelophila TaxID=1638984 RepID=UPI0007862211|nr:APC family permease [Demequina pelophila]